MIGPADIRRRAERIWNSGKPLKTWLAGESLFPLAIPFRRPAAKELLERFAEVRTWIEGLKRDSKAGRGYGYTVEFGEVAHRRLGTQALPRRILFETSEDFYRTIGRWRDFARFAELVQATRTAQPALVPWLERNPLRALEHAGDWQRLLAVVAWFQAHPRPGIYMRELDIPGVDSKFIEGHKALLRELLDAGLPPAGIDGTATALAAGGFERRYGLRFEEALIRFRLLAPTVEAPWGLTDLSVPLSQFRALDPPCRRIFITENKTNGLAFPPIAGALVIFGLGYGIRALREVQWLAGREIWYWGDIDTHGFAILSELRSFLPAARSLLMDRETLLAHRELWGEEPESKRFKGTLEHLEEDEQALFQALRSDALGRAVRLEQERIGFASVRRAICASGSAGTA